MLQQYFFAKSKILILCLFFLFGCVPKKGAGNIVKSKGNIVLPENLVYKYAHKLHVTPNSIKNARLFQFIDKWIAVPYKPGGTSKFGIDGGALAERLYQDVYFAKIPGTSQSLFENVRIIPKDRLNEGDLIFFKINSDDISHLGIYIINNKFIHVSKENGVIISDLQENYYSKFFFRSGRVQATKKS